MGNREMECRECEEWDGKPGNQRGYAGNLVEDAKNMGNKCSDTGNQGGNLRIAVEITQNSSVNNKKSGEKSE